MAVGRNTEVDHGLVTILSAGSWYDTYGVALVNVCWCNLSAESFVLTDNGRAMGVLLGAYRTVLMERVGPCWTVIGVAFCRGGSLGRIDVWWVVGLVVLRLGWMVWVNVWFWDGPILVVATRRGGIPLVTGLLRMVTGRFSRTVGRSVSVVVVRNTVGDDTCTGMRMGVDFELVGPILAARGEKSKQSS